ncbi:Cin1p [Sporobolomyces koalae]|uniref:Cin1p n=1 Tax=Sporobolomyces koalae TaxID=500713 RepID=UPI003179F06A
MGMPSSDQDAHERQVLTELCDQLDEYQEQSYLLDPSLESIVSPLIDKLRHHILALGTQALSKTRLQRIARLLYFVTKVRGAKVVVRFFPHEVTDLVHLLSLLSSSGPSSSSAPDPLLATSWELRYLLLLWLSVCVRLPFDLSKLERGTGQKIEDCAIRWIAGGSKEREGGIEVLARYYARQVLEFNLIIASSTPDLDSTGRMLLSKSSSIAARKNYRKTTISCSSLPQAMGLVEALCVILRSASPAALLPHHAALYHLLAFLPQDGKGGAVLGKLRVKSAGRLALLYLGTRQDRSEEDVPEAVETILGEMIEALSHPDTIVRWSAAKYLARLTLPLPAVFATNVIESVLSLFDECLSDSDRAEHGLQGACFAFGELGRRGLICSDDEVGRLLQCVLQALLFDRRRNMQTVGTSVRDSAAYVLWSLARTLNPDQVRPYAQQLAERLICVAVFDREVSIRRAASAAFQEAVGRWGVFPQGIDVLRKIDFFTVSVRHRAYLVASPSVAQHPEYRQPIIEHLLAHGITHYDPEVRELAAKALGKVTSLDSQHLAKDLLHRQIAQLETKDSAKLHGLLLSIATLVEASANLDSVKRDQLRTLVFDTTVGLLDRPPSARLLRTSSQVLYAALLALTFSALPISTLLADLETKNGPKQQAAVTMLGLADYTGPNEKSLVKVVKRLIPFISLDGNEKAATVEGRQHGVDALASILRSQETLEPLELDLFSAAFIALLPALNDYTSDQRGDVGSWVRVATARALTSLLPSLFTASSPFKQILTQELLDRVVGTFAKLAVERIDSVREAAGLGLVDISKAIASQGRLTLKGSALFDAIALEEDLSKWKNLAWSSEQVLPLLEIEEYRLPLLEGALIATNQHSSSTPLLDYLLTLPALPSTSNEFSLLQALRDLHALARRHFSSNRVFVPFLFMLSSLAEAGALDEIVADFENDGLKSVKMELAIAVNSALKIKAPQRVSASSKVVTSFLAVPSMGPLAASKISMFLLHPLDWLRQETADDLFGTISTLAFEEQMPELEALLTETEWSTSERVDEATRVVELLQEGFKSL